MRTTTKKMKKKKIQGLEEEERNSGGGSTSTLSSPPDRISELPVEILHRILGFLEMDEFLIQTSLVSTKWRNLWKSVSTLKFPVVVAAKGGGGGIRYNNVETYQNFVDHVLRLRDSEASKIQIFRYFWPWRVHNSREGGSLERVHNFIVSAVVNQGAQEIEILLGLDSGQSRGNNNIIHLNPSIFTSMELRKFTFQVYQDPHFQIQFPRSMCSSSSCATQLTHLNLDGIRLPEGNDDSNADQLHLVCPVLETLFMHCCYSKHLKVLDISAPRLKYLDIFNYSCMRFGGGYDFLGGCRIEIRTPNLTSLVYSGRVYVDCFTENLPRLDRATLDFTKKTAGVVEKTTSFATKLLKGLTSAKSLTLTGFEVFPEDVLKELLKPFTSLTTLSLATSCKISSIHGMVHILNSCKNIETLFWRIVVEICTVEGDDEHLMLPECSLSHLEHVRIHTLHGHKNEIEFVKLLLKSSIVLEEIKINTATDSLKRSIEENLRQFIEEEQSIRRSIKLHIL